ncbi:MAG: protein TonB [Candidatus Azotimanducaceae bacterium]|jgi:protein TonB
MKLYEWIKFAAVTLLSVGLLVACVSANRPPVLTSAQGPIYPVGAREQGIEGYVELAYDVAISGEVYNVRVVSADPAGLFEKAAIKAISVWRFAPAREKGALVVSKNRVSTIRFKLGETEKYATQRFSRAK